MSDEKPVSKAGGDKVTPERLPGLTDSIGPDTSGGVRVRDVGEGEEIRTGALPAPRVVQNIVMHAGSSLHDMAVAMCPSPRNHIYSKAVLCPDCQPIRNMLAGVITMARDACIGVLDGAMVGRKDGEKGLLTDIRAALKALDIRGVTG